DQFLPVAAQSQVGRDIDEWALKHACADLARLPREGDARVRIEVNVGRRMIESERIAANLRAYALDARVELSQIGLHVSERGLSTSRSALHHLRDRRDRGVKMYVDGFGSGRVPLERLASLPIDGIGIDRATITRIERDGAARAMCKSLVAIAHAFGLRATASGVETQQQLDFLTRIGCHAAQGRFLCAPAAIESLAAPTSITSVQPLRAVGARRS